MKIGLTGHTGVLGKILTDKLKDNFEVSLFNGDIRSFDAVNNWTKEFTPDAIFHFAAMVPVNIVEKNKFDAFEVNVIGTHNLAKSIQNLNKKIWMFYASSSHVYESKNSPIAETDSINPINYYGLTKYIGEQACLSLSGNNDISICIGRIFSFYHDSQKEPFLYPSIKNRVLKEDLNQPFLLRGANSVRDFLNAEQVIDIILMLYQKKYNGIVNIGSGIEYSIKNFTLKFIHPDLKIVYDESETNNYLVANIDKLNSVINE